MLNAFGNLLRRRWDSFNLCLMLKWPTQHWPQQLCVHACQCLMILFSLDSRSLSRKSDSPKKAPPPLNNDDDDGSTCSICLDTWESKGEHRLVSLKCGHLFGDSCIKRYIFI